MCYGWFDAKLMEREVHDRLHARWNGQGCAEDPTPASAGVARRCWHWVQTRLTQRLRLRRG